VRFRLGRGFERRQVVGPKPIKEIAHHAQPISAHTEEVARSLPACGYQACAMEYVQVVGNGLLGHREGQGNVADGAWLITNDGEDAAAVRVGEGAQGEIDGGPAHPLFKHTLVQVSTGSSTCP